MADFSSESLDLQKKVKEEDDNIKPMKEFESPEKLYDELIASVRKYHPSTDISLIEKAYHVARDAHEGQARKSGEPYIIHPLCVAVLLGTSAPFDSYYYAEDPQDKIFKIQRRIITKFAQEGPCVIVGRCANYILEQADIDSFEVFIRANIEKRMANVSDRVDLKGDELVKFLQKRDHKRRVYYRFYTKRKWGDYHDYNMMLDSGAIGKENCINLIIKAIGE